MTVEGVGFDQLRQTVVVLKDWEGKKLLPIWIGAAEAKAIAIELEGARPSRPLSHDLLLNIISTARGRVTRVIINDLQDSTFYATIDIETPLGMKHIDSRPSDALAVAVRAKSPVFVDGGAMNALIDVDSMPGLAAPPEELLEGLNELEGGSESEEGNDDEITRFRRLLGDD
jgi:hypothetical protein